jgi:hypothetical protein
MTNARNEIAQNRLVLDTWKKSYALRSLRKNDLRAARNLRIIKHMGNR